MTNYALQDEIKGFNFAFEFWAKSCRLHFSEKYIEDFAQSFLLRYAQTGAYNFAKGFFDGSMIVSRSRKNLEME